MADRDVAPAGADPTHYDLHLFPDLSTHTFSGTVTIHLSITKAMPFIQLHSRDLVISSAKFDTTGPAKEIVMDEKVETATIFSTSNLQPGLALLTLAFTGTINDKMYKKIFVIKLFT
jgi:aminopeptidase N